MIKNKQHRALETYENEEFKIQPQPQALFKPLIWDVKETQVSLLGSLALHCRYVETGFSYSTNTVGTERLATSMLFRVASKSKDFKTMHGENAVMAVFSSSFTEIRRENESPPSQLASLAFQ